MRQKAAVNPDVPLRACTQTHYFADTYPGLQQKNSSSEGARDIQGKTELYGFKVKAGGRAVIVPLLSHFPVQPAGEYHLAFDEPSPYMAKTESALAW